MIDTETGQEFIDADAALEFIRKSHEKMLDPGASQVSCIRATTEALYAFKALDAHLRRGGELPSSWQHARTQGPRDVLDMS